MQERPSTKFSSSVEADVADVLRLLMEEQREAFTSTKRVLRRMRDNARVRDSEGLCKLERFFSLTKASSSYLGLPTLRDVAFEAERLVDRAQASCRAPSPDMLAVLEEALHFAASELSLARTKERTSEQREQGVRILARLCACEPNSASVQPDELSDEELFAHDAARHVAQCREAIVRAADDGAQRSEAIHAAFRAMHTLKGNAGMMGYGEIEALGRAVEWTLEGLRSGELALTGGLTVALLNVLEKAASAIARPRAFQWQREAAALDVASTEARYIAQRTRIGALLVEHNFVSREQVDLVLAIKREPLGQALVMLHALSDRQLAQALDIQRKLRAGEELPEVAPATRRAPSFSVEGQKVSRLHEQLEGLSQLLSGAPAPVRAAVSELRETLQSLEDAPLRPAFQRAAALMRELAQKQRKGVQVTLHGEDVEVSRAVLGAVSDALVHLARNAVDHGIEPEAERHAQGKQGCARISLTARADGAVRIVELIDDGRGLRRDVLLQKAHELGIVDHDSAESWPDERVHALVFAPGFSTCDAPTELSGRGVGMDAVKHAIEALGGQVSIASREGSGTRVTLRVPHRPLTK